MQIYDHKRGSMRKGRKSPSMAGRPKKKKKIGRKILAALVLIGSAYLVYETVDFKPALEELGHDEVAVETENASENASEIVEENLNEESSDSLISGSTGIFKTGQIERIGQIVQSQINKFFEVKSFSVRGVESLVADSLTADLDTIIGLPILELDLFGIAESFRKHPRIRDVSVRRILPGTLRISIEERNEEALVLAGGKLYGVDSENFILSEPKPGWVLDRPIITGFSGDLKPGEKIEDEVVLEAIEWVRQSNRNPGVLGWISEVNIRNGRIETLMGNDGWEIKPGAHDLKKQIATMETFLTEIEDRKEHKGSVDLRFPEFLIVKRGS